MAINNYTDADFTSLLTRVNQIDGQNLIDPALGSLAVLTSKSNGQQLTTSQTVLALQSLIQTLQNQVNTVQTLLDQHLGISS